LEDKVRIRSIEEDVVATQNSERERFGFEVKSKVGILMLIVVTVGRAKNNCLGNLVDFLVRIVDHNVEPII
jgi:hypothetical protein